MMSQAWQSHIVWLVYCMEEMVRTNGEKRVGLRGQKGPGVVKRKEQRKRKNKEKDGMEKTEWEEMMELWDLMKELMEEMKGVKKWLRKIYEGGKRTREEVRVDKEREKLREEEKQWELREWRRWIRKQRWSQSWEVDMRRGKKRKRIMKRVWKKITKYFVSCPFVYKILFFLNEMKWKE